MKKKDFLVKQYYYKCENTRPGTFHVYNYKNIICYFGISIGPRNNLLDNIFGRGKYSCYNRDFFVDRKNRLNSWQRYSLWSSTPIP